MKTIKQPLVLTLIYWATNIALVWLLLLIFLLAFSTIKKVGGEIFLSKQFGILLTHASLTFITIFIGGASLYIFRRFLQNVKTGHVFTLKSIKYLKVFSYILILYSVISFAQKLFFIMYLATPANTQPTSLIDFFNLGILFFALFSLTLSHILSMGFQLKSEADLTV